MKERRDVSKVDKLVKFGFNLAVVGLFSVCGLLYAQQNKIIDKQDSKINYKFTELCVALDKKVDNQVLLEMIKTIKLQQSIDSTNWEKQDKMNSKVLNNLQELNVNVILLNEKLDLRIDKAAPIN